MIELHSDFELCTGVLITVLPHMLSLTYSYISPLRGRRHLRPQCSQPGSHKALNSFGAFLFALDTNKLMRQPADMRASLGTHILRARKAILELPGNRIDTVNQNLLLATPDNDTSNNLVKVREPL
jgi:hypothetical protein